MTKESESPVPTGPLPSSAPSAAGQPSNGTPFRPARESSPDVQRANSTGLYNRLDTLDARLREMLDGIGGDGKLKILREVEGRFAWCGSMEVTEDLVTNLEERMAKTYGGGDYVLRAYAGGQYVRSVSLTIDASVFPPRQSAHEKQRDGDRSHAPTVDIAAITRDAEARAERTQKGIFDLVMAMQDRSERSLATMAATMRPSTPTADANGSIVDKIREAAALFRSLGWTGPGKAGRGQGDDDAAGETNEKDGIVEGAIKAFAASAGSEIGSAVRAKMLAANTTTPGPAPVPPSQAPQGSTPGPAPDPTPSPKGTEKPDGRLSKQQIEDLRKQRTAGNSSTAPPATPARPGRPGKKR